MSLMKWVRRRKTITGLLVITAVFLLSLPMTAFADIPSFGKVEGHVQEIEESSQGQSPIIRLEDESGSPFGFRITKDVINMTDEAPEEGDFVTAYYDTRKPMIMIYPPEYPVVAFMVGSEQQSLFVGEFDENLIDKTNYLQLKIDEDTQTLNYNKEPYTGSLEGRELAVLYGAATKSIPAQTNPELVIVLAAEEAEPSEEPEQTEEPEAYRPDVSQMELVVEGEFLEAPAAWTTEDDIVMLPVRAIAEKIGFNVMWSQELRTVMLDDSITLTIGEDAYYNMKYDKPITLGTASEIRDGRTFVPLSFFREVIPMNNAYVFENQIVINNEEPME